MRVQEPTTPTYASTREEAARKMPWNVMGSALTVQASGNVSDALEETGLDYDVEMLPVTAYVKADDEAMPFAEFIDAKKFRAATRPMPDGTRKVMGITGTRFTPIQNRDAYKVADTLVTDHGALITGLADFHHGAATLLVLDLLNPVKLNRPDGGTDVIDLDLLIKNAHDGSAALTFALIGMRLACTNAVQAAINGAQRTWKVSHTPNAQQRVDLASTSILNALGYKEALQVKAQAMLDQPMVDAEFAKIVSRLWKVEADAEGAVADRKRETQLEIISLYKASPTLEGIRGTRWGGYNAITEYLDHYRPVKGADDAKVLARAEGALEGPNVRAKAKIWDLFAKV